MHIFDLKLIEDTRALAQQERHITRRILELIAVIDERRLYADLGYSSLLAWLVEDLHYSRSAAFRRIEGARLIRQVPAAKTMVESGEVNVTTLSMLQSAIRQEERRTAKPLSLQHKQELVLKIQDKSTDETDRVIAREFPELTPRPAEQLRAVGETQSKLTLILSEKQLELLNRVKEVTSHSHFNASWAELIEVLAEDFLNRKDLLRKKARKERAQNSAAEPICETLSDKVDNQGAASNESDAKKCVLGSEVTNSPGPDLVIEVKRSEAIHGQHFDLTSCQIEGDTRASLNLEEREEKNLAFGTTPSRARRERGGPLRTDHSRDTQIGSLHPERRPPPKPKALATRVKVKIIQRDGASCTYRSPTTGKICGCRHLVEFDHRVPRALGGGDEPANLRPLCRTHNALMARELLGCIHQTRRESQPQTITANR